MHFSISNEDIALLLQTFQQLDHGLQILAMVLAVTLLAAIGSALLSLCKYLLMFTIISFRGYPPPHCDALGSPTSKEDDDENDESEEDE